MLLEMKNSELILSKEQKLDRAMEIIRNMKPEDITKDNWYVDSQCKHCFVGLLDVELGINERHDAKPVAGWSIPLNNYLDGPVASDLCNMHYDYIHGRVDLENSKRRIIELLEAVKSGEVSFER